MREREQLAPIGNGLTSTLGHEMRIPTFGDCAGLLTVLNQQASSLAYIYALANASRFHYENTDSDGLGYL